MEQIIKTGIGKTAEEEGKWTEKLPIGNMSKRQQHVKKATTKPKLAAVQKLVGLTPLEGTPKKTTKELYMMTKLGVRYTAAQELVGLTPLEGTPKKTTKELYMMTRLGVHYIYNIRYISI